MGKTFFRIAVIIAVLGTGISCERTTDRISLKLRLRQGEAYTLNLVSDQIVSQSVYGQERQSRRKTRIGFGYVVAEVDGEQNALLRVTFQSVAFKHDGAGAAVDFDSLHPPESLSPADEVFAALAGRSFFITVSPDGRISKVEGVEQLLTEMVARLNPSEGPIRETLVEGLRRQYNEQSLREMMGNVMGFFPDEPVAVGESWTKNITVAEGFPMVLVNTWTLQKRENGVASIGVQSVGTPNSESSPVSVGNMKTIYHLCGEQRGRIDIDEDTGWIIHGRLFQQLSGHVMITNAPHLSDVPSWPISVESVTTFSSS